MKKYTVIMLCLLICLSALTGCSGTPAASGGKPRIVATIFPQYDWTRCIAGDRADVELLLDNGVDLHSYQPTADDIVMISTCDMFIYVGGESDKWVDDVLKNASNKDMIVINLLDVLGDAVKEEEFVEGMEKEEHDHDNDEDHGDNDEDEEGPEYDEHIWLSLRNASALCRAIAAKLGELDAANADYYTANANDYIEKLDALDRQYTDTLEASPVKTLLFADRFPFRYLADDYGLDYYAAFAGCSAETEASFETIIFLAKKADELGLVAIMQIESADGSIARTVRDSTKTKDQEILTLDSLQSITADEIENGVTYLSLMENNLSVLREALK